MFVELLHMECTKGNYQFFNAINATIFRLASINLTDCMKKALKELKRAGKSFNSIKALKADLKS